jgi:hypothetical protein
VVDVDVRAVALVPSAFHVMCCVPTHEYFCRFSQSMASSMGSDSRATRRPLPSAAMDASQYTTPHGVGSTRRAGFAAWLGVTREPGGSGVPPFGIA